MQQITIENFILSGVKRISSSEWEGELYQMSRSTFIKNKGDRLFGRPGVYVIYADHFNKQEYGNHIYVGQGNEVRQRLESHATNKTFWNHVLFFTAEWMNVAYAFNIEDEFIASVRLASRYVLDNDASGQPKQMGRDDMDRCRAFVAAAKSVAGLANIDVFTVNSDGIYCALTPSRKEVRLKVSDWDRPSVLVLADSAFWSSSPPKEAQTLLAEGRIERMDDREYLFKEDVEFELDETGALMKVLDIHASRFENSCGVKLPDAIKAVRNRRIHQEQV